MKVFDEVKKNIEKDGSDNGSDDDIESSTGTVSLFRDAFITDDYPCKQVCRIWCIGKMGFVVFLLSPTGCNQNESFAFALLFLT